MAAIAPLAKNEIICALPVSQPREVKMQHETAVRVRMVDDETSPVDITASYNSDSKTTSKTTITEFKHESFEETAFTRSFRKASHESHYSAEAKFLKLIELIAHTGVEAFATRDFYKKIVIEKESLAELNTKLNVTIRAREADLEKERCAHDKSKAEVKKLKIDLAASVAALAAATTTIGNRDHTIKELRQEIKDITHKFQHTISDLRHELEHAKEDALCLRNDLKLAHDHVHELEDELKKTKALLDSMTHKYQHEHQKHESEHKKWEKEHKEVVCLTKDLKEAEERIIVLERSLKEVTTKYETTTKEIHSLKETVKVITIERDALLLKIVQLEKEIIVLKEKVTKLTHECDGYKSANGDLEKEVVVLKAEIVRITAEYTKKIESLNIQIVELNTKVSTITKTITSKKDDEIKCLNKTIEKLKEEAKQWFEQGEEKDAELEKQDKEAEARYNKMKEDLTADYNNMKKKYDAMEHKNDESRRQIKALQEKQTVQCPHHDHHDHAGGAETITTTITTETEVVKTELVSARTELSNVKTELTTARTELTTVKAKYEDLVAKVNGKKPNRENKGPIAIQWVMYGNQLLDADKKVDGKFLWDVIADRAVNDSKGFDVHNGPLGGDPARGVTKALAIAYTFRGSDEVHYAAAPEHHHLKINRK